MTNILISCGPIPGKLDSVKYITNRFKGGLAFKTAQHLFYQNDYDVTIIKWKYTEVSPKLISVKYIDVDDVEEYYSYIKSNIKNYDAFILSAAVANLVPVNPWEGKFPSHNFKEGDEFDIKFKIAPRIIDRIKQINPRCTLIGYKLFDGTDEELIHAAKLTLRESKANVVFANHPKTAKEKKYALTQSGAVIPMSFDEHVIFIKKVIDSEYYSTVIDDSILEFGRKCVPDVRYKYWSDKIIHNTPFYLLIRPFS